MQFNLISDLHVEHWPDSIEWKGLGTSLVAVIVGDVSQDLDIMYQTVVEISKHYRHVVYVDGNHEHNDRGNINARREEIQQMFAKYRNITFLYRNTVVLDSVAFVGANGWFSFDFCEPFMTKQECFHSLLDEGKDQAVMFEQWEMAMEDADHMAQVIGTLNSDPGVKEIVMVTHTVPDRRLTWLKDDHNIHFLGVQGSSFLEKLKDLNTKGKMTTWVFGHLHQAKDEVLDGIRYISNPRGIPEHQNAQKIYYPKFIKN